MKIVINGVCIVAVFLSSMAQGAYAAGDARNSLQPFSTKDHVVAAAKSLKLAVATAAQSTGALIARATGRTHLIPDNVPQKTVLQHLSDAAIHTKNAAVSLVVGKPAVARESAIAKEAMSIALNTTMHPRINLQDHQDFQNRSLVDIELNIKQIPGFTQLTQADQTKIIQTVKAKFIQSNSAARDILIKNNLPDEAVNIARMTTPRPREDLVEHEAQEKQNHNNIERGIKSTEGFDRLTPEEQTDIINKAKAAYSKNNNQAREINLKSAQTLPAYAAKAARPKMVTFGGEVERVEPHNS